MGKKKTPKSSVSIRKAKPQSAVYSWNQAVPGTMKISLWRVEAVRAKRTLGMQVCPRGSHRAQKINQK